MLRENDDSYVKQVNIEAPNCIEEFENGYKDITRGSLAVSNDTDVNLRLLYNAEGKAEYIAAETASGYAIYHRDTAKLLEMSYFGCSPYKNITTETPYYFGPNNYVKKTNNVFKDVRTESELTSVSINALKARMNTVASNVANNSEVKGFNSLKTQIINNTRSYPPETNVDHYQPTVPISYFTKINNYEYIMGWNGESDFGNNAFGTCVAVALTLGIRYKDMQIDGGLVTRNGFIPSNWVSYNAAHPFYSNGSLVNQITSTDSVYEALHKYLATLINVNGNGVANADSARAAYVAYCNSLQCNYNVSTSYYINANITNVIIGLKTAISHNLLPSTGLHGGTDVSGNPSGGHSGIVYGYYTLGSTTFFLTHYGWNTHSALVINQAFLDNNFYTLAATNPHTTTNTFGHKYCTVSSSCYIYGANSTNALDNNGHLYKHTVNNTNPYNKQINHVCYCGNSHVVNSSHLSFHPDEQNDSRHYIICTDHLYPQRIYEDHLMMIIDSFYECYYCGYIE